MSSCSPPRVSTLLPAFNAAATLPACLRSLQRQTEPRWECVVVDDGSTDATLDVAQRYAAGDTRWRIVSTAHRGLVGVPNTGLAHCGAALIVSMAGERPRQQIRAALTDLGFVELHDFICAA